MLKKLSLIITVILISLFITGCGSKKEKKSVTFDFDVTKEQYVDANNKVDLKVITSDTYEDILWSQTSGSSVQIEDEDTLNAYFISPQLEESEELQFKIKLTKSGSSTETSVTVFVNKYTVTQVEKSISINEDIDFNIQEENVNYTLSLGEKTVDVKEKEIKLNTEEKDTELAVLSKDGEPIMLSVLNTNDEDLDISIESSADVFVFRSSRFYGLEIGDLEPLKEEIRNHENYNKLVEELKFQIETSPCPMDASCSQKATLIADEIASSINISNYISKD